MRGLFVPSVGPNTVLSLMGEIDSIAGYSYRLSETFNGTGLFVALKFLRDLDGLTYQVHGSSRESSWRTAVAKPPQFIESLRTLSGTLFGSPQTAPTGNWKPFVRISQYGTVAPTDRVYATVKTYSPFAGPWSASVIDNVKLSYHRASPSSVHFMDREDIWYFHQNFLDQVGSSATYTRSYSANTTKTVVSGLDVGDDLISYRMEVDSTSGGIKLSFGFTVTIYPSLSSENVVGFRISGHEKVKRTVLSSGAITNYTVSKPDYYMPEVVNTVTGDQSIANELVHRSGHSIGAAIPALYSTQGDVITAALGDVSRNFETLMELPSTVALVSEVLTGVFDVHLPKPLKNKGVVQKVKWVVKALLAAWITYIFAVRPALKSFKDVATTMVANLQEKFEASIVYESKTHAFSSLPQSLKDYIVSDIVSESDLLEYKITFHTELKLADVATLISRVIGDTAGHYALKGLIPEPKYIWAGLPLSFVVDWFVPISNLIGDAQAALSGVGMNFASIGHSVSIILRHKDGRTTIVYIRSDNTVKLFDPTYESWLLSGGVYTAAAVPLILLNSIFR